MNGALQGVRVLDLTQMMSGPYCTMMLGDQGDDVIKIEPPAGEVARAYGPHLPDDTERHFGGYFQSINRNKRSLVIDLKSADGKAVFRRLVRDADVVVENFRAGVMERLELPYESLAEINPALVYATIRGFGDPRTGASPYQDWPAYDIVAQAMGGIMHMTGPVEGPPTKVGPGVGDTIAAMMTAFGIVSAVLHARMTGEGQFVDVAMIDTIHAVCERAATFHGYNGEIADAVGNHHPFFVPFGTFPCQDGWVAVGCPIDQFWGKLATLMDEPEIGTDPRYATNEERIKRRDEVNGIVTRWTQGRTKKELEELIGGKVPFGPVNDIRDIVASPHTAARGLMVELPHPGSNQTVQVAQTPVRMTKTPGGAVTRAPTKGEHSDDVLTEAGFSADEIAALRDDGAVG
ncbi:MAG: CoA transferase [Rhodospirillaceae bacterium]|nr:CoA transferase [Rhodospirillaceae bacterium]